MAITLLCHPWANHLKLDLISFKCKTKLGSLLQFHCLYGNFCTFCCETIGDTVIEDIQIYGHWNILLTLACHGTLGTNVNIYQVGIFKNTQTYAFNVKFSELPLLQNSNGKRNWRTINTKIGSWAVKKVLS